MSVVATMSLQGALALQAPSYPPSAAQNIGQPISEVFYVSVWDAQSPTLSTDGQISIPFPIGMTQCHYLQIKVQGGSPIILYVTSADGTLQEIPVDDFIIMKMLGQPATALAVQRTPGVPATLTYVIAQKA